MGAYNNFTPFRMQVVDLRASCTYRLTQSTRPCCTRSLRSKYRPAKSSGCLSLTDLATHSAGGTFPDWRLWTSARVFPEMAMPMAMTLACTSPSLSLQDMTQMLGACASCRLASVCTSDTTPGQRTALRHCSDTVLLQKPKITLRKV